jgi:hypothetical protein
MPGQTPLSTLSGRSALFVADWGNHRVVKLDAASLAPSAQVGASFFLLLSVSVVLVDVWSYSRTMAELWWWW